MVNPALSESQFRVDHEQRETGGTIRAYQGSGEGQRWLGTMDYRTDQHPHGTTVSNIKVDEGARRQGVASRLYGAVHESTGKPFVHVADQLSPEGRKTVRALATQAPDLHRMAAYSRNGNQTSRPV